MEEKNLTFNAIVDENSNLKKLEATNNIGLDSKEKRSLKTSEAIELLNIWKREKAEELKLKKIIVNFLKRIIYIQFFFIALMVGLYGYNIWNFEEWTFRLIIMSIFVETVGVFVIVVKSLFPEDSNKNMIEFMKYVYSNTKEEK